MHFEQQRIFSSRPGGIFKQNYMDDYVASVPRLEEAQSVSAKTRVSLKQAGFQLIKFLSNNKLAL